MTAALAAGLLAGYGIAVPVGAVATYLIALTARTSWRVGVCAALGVATADGLYALVAVIGGAALAPLLRPVMLPVRWGAAGVLVVLAVRIAATAIGRYRGRRAPAGNARAAHPVRATRAYLGLLGLTMLNPTTVLYFAALVLGSRTAAAFGHLDRAVFVTAAFAASASWQLLLAGSGALLGRALTGDRGQLVTAVTSGAVLCIFAAHLLVTAS